MDAGTFVRSGGEHMTEPLQEQLSACLDGTLSEAELDLLIKRVERDADLAATLGRYALIGEALKAEKPVAASAGFAKNVMAALAQEPAARRSFGLSRVAMRRLRPVAGFAVAAGVAAVAVFSVQRAGLAPDQVAVNSNAPTSFVVNAPTEDPSYVVPTSTSNTALVPATRLTNYVVAHSEYSSPLGRRSVLSSVLAEDDLDDAAQAEADAMVEDATKDDATKDGAAPER
jgi:sigma-E factor negative regulatory protein RseA